MKYRIDYQSKVIYEWDEEQKAYLYIGHFCNFTKKELREIRLQEEWENELSK